MRFSALLPLALIALATATPLPSSSQDNALEARDPNSSIINPITSRAAPTLTMLSSSVVGPVNSRSAPNDDITLVGSSLNDVFIPKKRGWWAKFDKWFDCNIATNTAADDNEDCS